MPKRVTTLARAAVFLCGLALICFAATSAGPSGAGDRAQTIRAADDADSLIAGGTIPLLAGAARERASPAIGLSKALNGQPGPLPDKIHPNTEGARLMAAEIQGTQPRAPRATGALPRGRGEKALPPATRAPRALIIGDSIAIGYTEPVRELLKGRADVRGIPENAGHTGLGLEKLDGWLGGGDWDVIHFNWGLWDLAYRPGGSKVQGLDKVNGIQTWSPGEYERNLRELVKRLKATKAKLVWAATTPVPEGEPGRFKGDEVKYNAIAEKIMKENGVAIDDLYSHALRRGEEIHKAPGDAHFTEEGYRYLAQQAAASILEAIETSGETQGPPPSSFPGEKGMWFGYDHYGFTVDGRSCLVVAPKVAAAGKPWIWRAQFFGHEPQTDLALLSRGFHLVYMDVADLYGCPRAVAHWNAFYAYLTEKHGFAKKAVLEGMSRGGLIIYNWAATNPDKVACVYADAPVCDIKSWPGGKGRGPGSPPDWQACLQAYGLTEEGALAYDKNPIDNLEPLAKARVALLHVCGGADEVVPVEENTAVLQERYKKIGGRIEVIIKEGGGHHPHSLKDPAPIVDFILKHATSERPEAGR